MFGLFKDKPITLAYGDKSYLLKVPFYVNAKTLQGLIDTIMVTATLQGKRILLDDYIDDFGELQSISLYVIPENKAMLDMFDKLSDYKLYFKIEGSLITSVSLFKGLTIYKEKTGKKFESIKKFIELL